MVTNAGESGERVGRVSLPKACGQYLETPGSIASVLGGMLQQNGSSHAHASVSMPPNVSNGMSLKRHRGVV